MSGVGGDEAVEGVDLTFTDAAPGLAPASYGDPLVSGSYRVSNHGDYWFDTLPNVDSFSGFAGLDAIGRWTLVLVDNFSGDTGSIAGFRLTITTDAEIDAAVPEPATWVMMLAGFGLVGTTLRRRRPALA